MLWVKLLQKQFEGLDKIIRDMVETTKKDRSDMVGDIISTSRRVIEKLYVTEITKDITNRFN